MSSSASPEMNGVNLRIIHLLKSNKKYTQRDLAAKIGVSASTLNNWLKLMRDIPPDKIIPICEYFNVSADYLLTGVDAPTKKELPIASIFLQLPPLFQERLMGLAEGMLIAYEAGAIEPPSYLGNTTASNGTGDVKRASLTVAAERKAQ